MSTTTHASSAPPPVRPTQPSATTVRSAVSDAPERLVKSVERVRDLGEVFTPANTILAMLDMLPDDMWRVHPAPTFLEPACGDGNFLIEILDRKLARIGCLLQARELPAGRDQLAVAFHALEALASIYAVDISVDNVVGGIPGHDVGARDRVLTYLEHWYEDVVEPVGSDSPLRRSARWIVERNIQVGNMLDYGPDGRPSGRDQLPLVEYRWSPPTRTVQLFSTTIGAVMAATASAISATPTLFGVSDPVEAWAGEAMRITDAPILAPVPAVTHTSNGRR